MSVSIVAEQKDASNSHHNLGLYTYQTLDAADFELFDKDYGMAYCTPTTEDAGCHNFNKPNMTAANPRHTETNPTLEEVYEERRDGVEIGGDTCSLRLYGTLPKHLHEKYGAPSFLWVSIAFSVPESSSGVTMAIDVQWFNKTATRLAEAQWVTFNPNLNKDYGEKWLLRGFRSGLSNSNADYGIDPTDVVMHGAVHLHSLGPFAVSGSSST